MKLREDRSYGTVYGHTRIAYEQDGRQFGPDKMVIEGPVLDPSPPAVLDPTPTPDPERSRKMKEAWERRKAAQSQVNS